MQGTLTCWSRDEYQLEHPERHSMPTEVPSSTFTGGSSSSGTGGKSVKGPPNYGDLRMVAVRSSWVGA